MITLTCSILPALLFASAEEMLIRMAFLMKKMLARMSRVPLLHTVALIKMVMVLPIKWMLVLIRQVLQH